MTAFSTWFDTFIDEKRIDPEMTIEVEGESGANFMPLQVVFDAIKTTRGRERDAIKQTIVKIDFMNGDVVHFFRHLAKALAI